jgi:regulator of cell morphogenesis and NO signaling
MAMRVEDMTVVELTTTHPLATRVLYRHGIEFCAGASRSLTDACREAAVEVGAVLAEVEREEAGGAAGIAWSDRPLGELVDHILVAFHAVERLEMDAVQGLLAAAAATLPRLAAREELAEAFDRLRTELTEHMAKEEAVLFPWLRSGRGDLARTPIQVMMMEHESTLRLVNEVRGRLRAFAAAAPLRAADITGRLAELDRHVREHMHLENNVLFTRALRGEA